MNIQQTKPKTSNGFWLPFDCNKETQEREAKARPRALSYFPGLQYQEFEIRKTRLGLWSHHSPNEAVHATRDGTLLALIGSPVGNFSWLEIEKQLADAARTEDFKIPRDGRVILLSSGVVNRKSRR